MNGLAALSARESRVISSHGIQVDGKEEAPLTTESILMSYVRDASPHSNHEGYGYTGHSSEDDAFANSASVSSESESDDESFQTCDANSDNGLGVQSQHGSSNAKKSNLASYYKAKASIRRVVDKLGSKT